MVAGPLGITHMIPVSTGARGAVNLRVGRLPRGPTLTLRVKSFTSMAEVAAMQRKPVSSALAYNQSPLVILNGFGAGSAQHMQLAAVMFQNMFPAIDVATVKLADCRRVAMFHIDKESGDIEFRHYFIRTKAADTSRAVKRILRKGKNLPNLSSLEDISDYFNDGEVGGYGSESEGEDDPSSQVDVVSERKLNRREARSSGSGSESVVRKSSVRLQELGPRIRMKLIKVEDGLFDGDVIHHAYLKKTPEEAAKLRESRKMREAEKNKRRSQQEANVERKKAKAAAAGTRNSRGQDRAGLKAYQNNEGDVESDDDDAYMRQALGDDDEDEGADGKVKGKKGGKGSKGGRVFGKRGRGDGEGGEGSRKKGKF